MKFLKYGGIGLLAQVVFLIAARFIDQFLRISEEGDFILWIYYPFMMFVIKSGNLEGESAMIEGPVLGIVFGMFTYATIIGLIIWFLSQKKYD
jgi:hypothetical protein